MRQTAEQVTESVIPLPRGGSVTVQFNSYLVIEHPIIRCVLFVDALWVGLWKYTPPDPTYRYPCPYILPLLLPLPVPLIRYILYSPSSIVL